MWSSVKRQLIVPKEDDTTLMAESEEELKSLLIKVKEESEKVGFRRSGTLGHGLERHLRQYLH